MKIGKYEFNIIKEYTKIHSRKRNLRLEFRISELVEYRMPTLETKYSFELTFNTITPNKEWR